MDNEYGVRWDRCGTCHKGFVVPGFSRELQCAARHQEESSRYPISSLVLFVFRHTPFCVFRCSSPAVHAVTRPPYFLATMGNHGAGLMAMMSSNPFPGLGPGL